MSTVRNTITFSEAAKTSKRYFTTLVKPVGSSCNLRCDYCYYLDKANLYGSAPQQVMSDELLEEYVRQYLSANEAEQVTFCWHGGEPLLAGLEFYKKAMKHQKRYARGRKIENTLQTNGILVNDDWCKFFRDNNFLVGISLDGPQDIHDAYRKNVGGVAIFDRVMRSVERFARNQVEFNTLSVVNNLCEGRGKEVYNFFKSIGSRYMQFLPAVERSGISVDGSKPIIQSPFSTDKGDITPWSVSPLGFGHFMIDIFDEWIKRDVGVYYVQMFDVTLAQFHGVKPSLCSFAKSCGDGLVVEHNGDVYSCDHFVYPEYLLGNILKDELKTMYSSQKQLCFGISKRNSLSGSCQRCKFYFACTGGCPKHRFGIVDQSGSHAVNYLCAGYKMFFEHVAPTMTKMSDLLTKGRSPMEICEK